MNEAGERGAGEIGFTVKGGIARVIIDRPERRNAMRLAMWREMKCVFEKLGAEPEIRAIILTGSGADFSVGADVSEFPEVRANAAQSAAYEEDVDACGAAIASAPKPTIAALSGYCLGGGCHLALACDFRIADETAVVGIPAARLSIVYSMRSSHRLLNLVGLTNAKRMLFSAKPIAAEEALMMGLIDGVHASALEGAVELAADMSDNAPLSIAGSKFILDGLTAGRGRLDEVAAQRLIDAACDSSDYREAVAAFSERRRPVFNGQ